MTASCLPECVTTAEMILGDDTLYTEKQLKTLTEYLVNSRPVRRVRFCILHTSGVLNSSNAVMHPYYKTPCTVMEVEVPQLVSLTQNYWEEIAQHVLAELSSQLQSNKVQYTH